MDFRTNNILGARLSSGGHLQTFTGCNSLFVGEGAGLNNNVTSGIINTFLGYRAGMANTVGNQNTAVGYYSMNANLGGIDNTAVGAYTLMNGTGGLGNTAIGLGVLENNSGNYNTCLGYGAGGSNTTGNRNVAVGCFTMGTLLSGTYNTVLGSNVDIDDGARTNTVSIGGSACLALGGSNRVRIGNASMGSIGGQVGWSTISDGRFKENVHEDVPGLAFILKLRPVTYTFNLVKENDMIGGKDRSPESVKSLLEGSKVVYSGFIAQDVEKAAAEVHYDFSGVNIPKDSRDYYTLRYAEFVVPIIKAMQEQQQIIEQQQREIELLKTQVRGLTETRH